MTVVGILAMAFSWCCLTTVASSSSSAFVPHHHAVTTTTIMKVRHIKPAAVLVGGNDKANAAAANII